MAIHIIAVSITGKPIVNDRPTHPMYFKHVAGCENTHDGDTQRESFPLKFNGGAATGFHFVGHAKKMTVDFVTVVFMGPVETTKAVKRAEAVLKEIEAMFGAGFNRTERIETDGTVVYRVYGDMQLFESSQEEVLKEWVNTLEDGTMTIDEVCAYLKIPMLVYDRFVADGDSNRKAPFPKPISEEGSEEVLYSKNDIVRWKASLTHSH